MEQIYRRGVLAALGAGAFGRRTRRPDAGESFVAVLTGANQVPPVETDAFGFAVFRVGPGARRIGYRLFVADVENATEAHVHKGPPDLNGNVVAYLFGPADDPVTTTGLLSSGALSDDEMIWPLTGVSDLREQMRAANVYVNVHTTARPSGEIRGQIRPLRA